MRPGSSSGGWGGLTPANPALLSAPEHLDRLHDERAGGAAAYVLSTEGMLNLDQAPPDLGPGTLTINTPAYVDRTIKTAELIQRVVPSAIDNASLSEMAR